MELLEEFITHYFRVLKNGGTLIIFFDIWEKSEKESELIRLKNKFKDNLKEGGEFLHLKTIFAADIKNNK
jgi:hypothetical protein